MTTALELVREVASDLRVAIDAYEKRDKKSYPAMLLCDLRDPRAREIMEAVGNKEAITREYRRMVSEGLLPTGAIPLTKEDFRQLTRIVLSPKEARTAMATLKMTKKDTVVLVCAGGTPLLAHLKAAEALHRSPRGS